MKSFVVFCVALVAGIQAASVTLPPTQNEEVNINVYACIEESGVPSEVLAEGLNGNFRDDESLKKFTHCFFERSGIVTSDGKLNIDVALAKLPSDINKDDTKVLLERCKSRTGKDATDTVYEMYKCYFLGSENLLKDQNRELLKHFIKYDSFINFWLEDNDGVYNARIFWVNGEILFQIKNV